MCSHDGGGWTGVKGPVNGDEGMWTYLKRVSGALAEAASDKERKDEELKALRKAYEVRPTLLCSWL